MKNKIIILGDIIIDKYIHGNVEKISQEAPTAIVNIEPSYKEKITLGGAANVAANVKSLGTNVELLSIIGNDTNSSIAKKILKKKKIKHSFIKLKNYNITEKTRVISNSQQIIRLDKDSKHTVYNQRLLEKKLIKALINAKILIISDYNKGTIQNISKLIKIANKKKIKTLIDSKNEYLSNYRNSFLMKPNKKEFQNIFKLKVNEPGLNKKVVRLLKENNISYLLLTLGDKGMKLFSQNSTKSFFSEIKEVYDVTGAGDTVLASLAHYLVQKNDLVESVKFSLKAAGVVVGKLGTSEIKLSEIQDKYKQSKIFNIKDLYKELGEHKKNGKKIVFTNGCFDMLHSGHIHILKESKKEGDILVVGLNSDQSIKSIKGNLRPIVNEIDRAMHLNSLECVDYITIYSEKTPDLLIKKIKPNILTKGDEYKNKLIVGKNFVIKNKGKVVLIKKYKNYSTTKLLENK